MILFRYFCIIYQLYMVREKIRNAIIESGKSQGKFCSELGIASSNFNAWLNGNRTLPYPSLVKVLLHLGLSVGPKSVGFSYLPANELPEVFLQQMSHICMRVKDVSSATGIDPSVLSSFLTGARRMSTNNVEKAMNCLNLDIVTCTSTVKVV